MEMKRNNVHPQLDEILHMNGADGDNSYANNSFLQKKVMLKAKPILQESIVELYKKNALECITMVDMGCSSGPNSLLPVWEVIDAIDEECRRLNKKIPIFQVFLNDLPKNDFNSIFRSLPTFYKKIEEEKGNQFGHCFIAAMPGTFHRRLFPPGSLHFVHSSISLHWLSQVPKIPENKDNIYLAKTSPPVVHKAYLDQFERDFTAFLRARSEEMIPQGRMVLTLLGRHDDNMQSFKKYTPHLVELLGMMLNDMVFEGLIEESKLDTFNLPFYGPSADEVKNVIKEEGSFNINRVETFDIGWDASIDDGYEDKVDKYTKGKYVANHLRAIFESMMVKHFGGSEIVDVIFQKFSVMMADYLEKEYGTYTFHIISMTKD